MPETYYRLGFFERSAISDIIFRLRVPAFECPACHDKSNRTYFAYPTVDPTKDLNVREIELLRSGQDKSGPAGEVLECIQKLEAKFRVPVAPGTSFGPIRIKVSSKPKTDFDALGLMAGVFLRRGAAEKLFKAGIHFESVTADAFGKHGKDADFVQIFTPVLAHNPPPPDYPMCPQCKRVASPKTWERVLYRTPRIEAHHVFMTLEGGTIIFSKRFIDAVHGLGITGLVDGSTIKQIRTEPHPAPSTSILEKIT